VHFLGQHQQAKKEVGKSQKLFVSGGGGKYKRTKQKKRKDWDFKKKGEESRIFIEVLRHTLRKKGGQ